MLKHSDLKRYENYLRYKNINIKINEENNESY